MAFRRSAVSCESQLREHDHLVVLGDFNIAPEDARRARPQGLARTASVQRRSARRFKVMLDLGLVDSFRLFEQAEKSFSWWDYRDAAFRRNLGLRIDHILASRSLCGTLHRLPHRQGAAAPGAAFGSRAGRCRVRYLE